MPTIEVRTLLGGATAYRAKVRVTGYPEVTKTFARKADAESWGHVTEAAVRNRRHTGNEPVTRHLLGVGLA